MNLSFWERVQPTKRFCWDWPAFILKKYVLPYAQHDFSQESWVGLFVGQYFAPFDWTQLCSVYGSSLETPVNAGKCHRTWTRWDFLKSNREKTNNNRNQINQQMKTEKRWNSSKIWWGSWGEKRCFQGHFHVNKMFSMSRHFMLLKDWVKWAFHKPHWINISIQ